MNTELEEIKQLTNIDLNVIHDVIATFKSKNDSNINPANVINVTTELMKLVGNLKNVSGPNKKIVVTKVIIFLIKENSDGSVDEFMDAILENVVPVVIDKLVMVEGNKLVFNKKIKSKFSSCFGSSSK